MHAVLLFSLQGSGWSAEFLRHCFFMPPWASLPHSGVNLPPEMGVLFWGQLCRHLGISFLGEITTVYRAVIQQQHGQPPMSIESQFKQLHEPWAWRQFTEWIDDWTADIHHCKVYLKHPLEPDGWLMWCGCWCCSTNDYSAESCITTGQWRKFQWYIGQYLKAKQVIDLFYLLSWLDYWENPVIVVVILNGTGGSQSCLISLKDSWLPLRVLPTYSWFYLSWGVIGSETENKVQGMTRS